MNKKSFCCCSVGRYSLLRSCCYSKQNKNTLLEVSVGTYLYRVIPSKNTEPKEKYRLNKPTCGKLPSTQRCSGIILKSLLSNIEDYATPLRCNIFLCLFVHTGANNTDSAYANSMDYCFCVLKRKMLLVYYSLRILNIRPILTQSFYHCRLLHVARHREGRRT